MTARERQTSGGPGAALADIRREQVTPFPLLAAGCIATRADRGLCWDELYSFVPSTLQKHLVELALSQGLLHDCPVPPFRSPAAPAGAASESSRFQLLSHLLQGKTGSLPPFRPEPVTWFDAELDEEQRDAVAKAVHTPDICLVQGLPGTGKSRVAAEIVAQATAQGRRVLLLASTAAAIDRALEMMVGREHLYALRCLGSEESLDRLPAAAQALTFAERSRILRQRTLESARRTQAETQERLQSHAAERQLWPKLQDLCVEHARHDQELAHLIILLQQLPAAVENRVQAALAGAENRAADEGEAAWALSLSAQVAERSRTQQQQKAGRDDTRRQLAQERDTLIGRRFELTTQANLIRPLALARQKVRWWSPVWWRATFRGNVAGELAAVEAELETTQGQLDQLDRAISDLHAADESAGRQLAEQVEHLKQQCLAEQSDVLRQRLRVIAAKTESLRQQWQHLLGQLPHDGLRPLEMTAGAVSGAQARWEQHCAREEEKDRFLGHWLGYVEEFSATLASRLPRLANVVAATVGALPHDQHFGDPQGDQHFDLLVLDEAHLITEQDLFKITRRMSQWVLIGEPGWSLPERDGGERHAPARGGHSSRATPIRRPGPSCFRRLWTQLHCDPSQSPYDWHHAGDRLCCRLRPIPAQWADFAETEAVADRPDVELRIVTPPREAPFLAEILFPATMPLHEAKQYIHQELQEVAIRTGAHQLLWSERDGRIILPLASSIPPSTQDVPLSEGVIERLAAQAPGRSLPRTVTLEFLCENNWTLERAQEWVAKHLGWRDLGRTSLLVHAHRMSQSLGAVLEKFLFDHGRRSFENGHAAAANQPDAAAPSPLEFVAVPSLPDRRDRRRRDESGQNRSGLLSLLPVGGAGLEVDLSPGKTTEMLPDELRDLPAQGVVNLPEAQAVVHKLEELVHDPALHQGVCVRGACASCPTVAVVALSPAQAELIRRLMRKSARLTHGNIHIEVGLPGAFRHRECQVCVVSLIRSQGSRAVAYSDTGDTLPLVLTRARQRIILLGDAGQLVRRGQWRGPLDRLDETAAAQEKRWVDQLLKHLQTQIPHE